MKMKYYVSTSMFAGSQLPCVRDEADNEIVAAGCLPEDAALFAAAPELLEACILLCRDDLGNGEFMNRLAFAKAAIAKAKGKAA
jgi:hypothetical protein